MTQQNVMEISCSPGNLNGAWWRRVPVACERSIRMMENSGVSENQVSVVDANCLSDQEVMLLAMFRAISVQRQKDVLRLLEVFTQAPE